MKANAPDKIYVHVRYKPCEITFSEVKEEGVSNVEYIRTDALIDKAAKWINEHTSLSEKLVIENFVNYMKEE